MILAGSIGIVAAAAGYYFSIVQPVSFVIYWFSIGAAAVCGAFLMSRRQAWQQSEPFWSPPTRRVAQAMLPALFAGFALGALVLLSGASAAAREQAPAPNRIVLVCLPLAWVILYGCAIHAAGFFMQRGMRLFGWGMVLGGSGGFLALGTQTGPGLVVAGFGIMGFFFGALHLAYGIYLYFTEQRRNDA